MTESTFSLKVYYEDTDAGGVVYHSNYLKFAERARTEMLNERGIFSADLMERLGVAIVVSRKTIAYKRPARLENVLTVRTRTTGAKAAAIDIEQRIFRGDELLVEVNSTAATVELASGRPVRIPAEVREKLGL